MGQISASRSIDAPPEAVFDAIANFDNLRDVNPDIVGVEFLSEQRSGVGTRFRETRVMRGKEATTELEVTEHAEPEHIRIVSDEGGAVWDTVMRVEARDDGGSELRMVMEDRPHTLGARLVIPFIRGMIDRAIQQDMDRVKVWCEERNTSRES